MIRSRHAFTLIELLVAMGIAVLLAAVVFAIYAGVLRTLDSQSRWRAAAYPASAALDALSRDLSSAVVPWGITNASFVLTPSLDGADGFKLHFFTATPISAAPWDARAYAIREMDYVLSASNAAGTNGALRSTSGLIRAWAAFRIDEASGIVSNRDVWASVRAIRLEVFDGKYWTNTWGGGTRGGGTNVPLPQAARVMLTMGNESVSRQIASEVLIPAGHRIAAPKSRKLKTN
jgi:prepilin-type N-terminal cleavage/methylation domain-containing protein